MSHFIYTYKNEITEDAKKLLPMFREAYKEIGIGVVQVAHDMCQSWLDESGIWEKTNCKNACSFCCHDTIPMTKLEAEYTKEILKLNNLSTDAVRSKLQRELPKESLNFMARACPLLADEDENGKRLCSIYEARPLVCRTHNSQDDPKYCNRVEFPNKTINEGRSVRIEAITFALIFLEQELGLQGEESMMVGMHEI